MSDWKFIVVDASVVINLNATGYSAEILQAFPYRVLVPEIVDGELESGRSRGRTDHTLLRDLVDKGVAELIELGSVGERWFEKLVVGATGSTLDDGEAATVACALELDAIAVIDDQKAMRICREKFPSLKVMCTVDLFRIPHVLRKLGASRLQKALLNALQVGRMRVLPQDLDWVVDQIGIEQAKKCPSLPRSSRLANPGGRVGD